MAIEENNKQIRVGIDVGGTFTDIVMVTPSEFRTAKILNTPNDPKEGILLGISEMGAGFKDISEIMHGTTLGTNLLIEKKGPVTGLLTTEGFKDILEIQRQDKTEVYNLRYRKSSHLIPRKYCFEIKERLNSKGEVILPLDRDHLKKTIGDIVASGVQALAVNFLHSYKNDTHEKIAQEIIAREACDLSVSLSSRVLPQFREYERATATVINAYLARPLGLYIKNLLVALRERGFSGELYLLQSNGGVIGPPDIEESAIKIVLSGPSGGAAAASCLAKRLNIQKMITMDMGGTSTDTSVLINGEYTISFNRDFEGLPLSIPMIDIESIGAGGGSLAWIDTGGMLHVGPQSAGANPGPACYCRGGKLPTVTDANMVLGLVRKEKPLGNIRLDMKEASLVVSKIAEPLGLTVESAAEAIRSIANSNMEHAIRLVTSERGHEPNDFVLLAFGGAGPLHAVEVAKNLSIKTVVVPRNAGLFSAMGCLISDIKKDYIKTDIYKLSKTDISRVRRNFSELEVTGLADMKNYGFRREDVEVNMSLDIRYSGQAYETNLPIVEMFRNLEELRESFDKLHFEMYGRCSFDLEIEIINYRLTVVGKISPIQERIFAQVSKGADPGYRKKGRIFYRGNYIETIFYDFSSLAPSQAIPGPAVVEDETSTLFIPPGWAGETERDGNIIVRSVE